MFEKFLEERIPEVSGFHPHFEKALKSILLSGGKRFRPQLIFAVVEALQPRLLKNSYHVAFGIEALHTYSLVHDDLPAMDDADLRRGVETLHKTYDEVTAILVGDALNTLAFEIISESPFRDDVRVKLIRSLAKNGGLNGMVIGQAIDCYFENMKLPKEQIEFLHIHKTGKLIASALQMGAIISDRQDLEKPLFDFGISVGLLFQIQDDILDVIESEDESGKTTNRDEEKNSFVTVLGLENTIEEAEKLAEKVNFELDSFPNELKKSLKKLLEKYIYRHRK
jgi:geranylgeranyl pyrophosphate synthase